MNIVRNSQVNRMQDTLRFQCFVTSKKQKEILQRIEAGNVDVVVGTHRLLSKDIKPGKLGLVIVDEEQRFGVKHKEHFKKLRANVDVLTLQDFI